MFTVQHLNTVHPSQNTVRGRLTVVDSHTTVPGRACRKIRAVQG